MNLWAAGTLAHGLARGRAGVRSPPSPLPGGVAPWGFADGSSAFALQEGADVWPGGGLAG